MKVSLICSCKNRVEPLKISLASWLNYKEIHEIIIVDWSSDESIEYLTELDSRINVITVPDQKYFNQPQPLNLAASIATGDHILKVDGDYILSPYFNFFDFYKIDNHSFVCGQNDEKEPTSSNPYFKYLRGLLFVTAENYEKVGGYNEDNTKYYAYEDDEIVHRLELLGLRKQKVCYNHHIIHIPHPDKKRLENFEAYHTDKELEKRIRDMLSPYHSGDELQWQVDYTLAQQHIEINRQKSLSEITDYYFKSSINWMINQTGRQTYTAVKTNMKKSKYKSFQTTKKSGIGKLENFPKVYYVSLEECDDRRENLNSQFSEYEIVANPIISKRFSESSDIVRGKYVHTLNDGTAGCCVSHLKALREWYYSCNDEYGFFCEDDLSLETVKYWDFTWEEFVDGLPSDWTAVQLLTIRGDYPNLELRNRYWDDWSATAYILKREYVKRLLDVYIRRSQGNKEDIFNLNIPDSDVQPLIENILFATPGTKTYTVPLFIEENKFQSTFSKEQDDDVNSGQKNNHYHASKSVLDLWKLKNKQTMKTVNTDLNELLKDFSMDVEDPMRNFRLGVWYESNGHTAPALSYFLRCAERSTDNDLAYESLIRSSYCYEKQGTRDGTAKGLLQQAIILMPTRPEAYFLLSRFSERREWWQDCYIYAEWGLIFGDHNPKPLLTDVEYPGKYALLFEKAVSSWWWEKTDQSIEMLVDLVLNYDLNSSYKKAVIDNLVRIGVPSERYTPKGKISFEDEYRSACETPSDINENLPVLYELAKDCEHVTEFGVRSGSSTRAFLNSDVALRSYDLEIDSNVNQLFEAASSDGKDVRYFKADVLDIEIEETDLLFIDTWHQYYQLQSELSKHAGKVRKYLVFHDTQTYAMSGESCSNTSTGKILTDTIQNPKGLLPCIIEFMVSNPQWIFKTYKTNNNGMIVLEKKI